MDTSRYMAFAEEFLPRLEKELAGHDHDTLACLLAAVSHITGHALVELVGLEQARVQLLLAAETTAKCGELPITIKAKPSIEA